MTARRAGPTIHTDEATTDDQLNRRKFVQALSVVISKCDTPFVVGVFGEWGAGKTSIMQMLQEEVAAEGARTVWFDAWLHQDDESPAAALLQTMVSQLELGTEGRKMLTVMAAALGSVFAEFTASVKAEDVKKLGEQYEAERFQVRDARIRLREHFSKLVSIARGPKQSRLVFFVDDLDRCQPDTALSVLEALRLYLNLEGCVYVVGADRLALQRAVARRYGIEDSGNIRYIDKVVQLPFFVPQLSAAATASFVGTLLPKALKKCAPLLTAGLGANPRGVKRFVNILSLHHELASDGTVSKYDPNILTLLLLVQYLDPERFALIAADPTVLQEMVNRHETEGNVALKAVMSLAPSLPENLGEYIYLTESSGVGLVEEEAERPRVNFMKPVIADSKLAEIVGSEPLPRTELTKKVWSYIKKNGLQDKANRRNINTDDKLKAVFGGKSTVNMFQMTAYVSKHIKEQ